MSLEKAKRENRKQRGIEIVQRTVALILLHIN